MKPSRLSILYVPALVVSIALIGNILLSLWTSSSIPQVEAQQVKSTVSGDTAVLNLDTPPDPLIVGTLFTTTVQLTGLTTPLHGFQFDLTYDETILQLVEATPSDILGSNGRFSTCASPTTSTNRVRFGCASSGMADGVLAAGSLATLTFVALDVGTSPLSLSEILLLDGSVPPAPISASSQDSQVQVVPDAVSVALGEGQTLAGLPGQTLTHFVTVTNTGSYTDTFILDVSNFSWPTTLQANSTDPLPSGDSIAVPIMVQIPTQLEDVTIGADSFQLTAVSSFDTAVFATTTGTTLANVTPDVALAGLNATEIGEPATTLTHTFILTNTGSYTDSFSLQLAGNAWPTTLSATDTGDLGANGSFSFLLTVTIPADAGGQVDTATVTAVSALDNQISDTFTVTTVASEPVDEGHTIYLPAILHQQTPQARPAPARMNEPAHSRPATPTPMRPANCYLTDIDCDLDVDEHDLTLAASSWYCTTSDACYETHFDINGDGLIELYDLVWIGNEYDTDPPTLSLLTPLANAVISGTQVWVSGTVSDTHPVTVQVNETAVSLNNNSFGAFVPILEGNQLIHVVATDAIGQTHLESRLVQVDRDGPTVDIHQPRHRQAVYTLTPTVAISYTDFYTQTDSSSLTVWLTDEQGGMQEITGDLIIQPNSAQGQVTSPLTADMSYTLMVSVADAYGNLTQATSTFYVPDDPTGITPPPEPERAGWVSGRVFDSATCDEHLTTCVGLAGARVTLEQVDTQALEQLRLSRQQQLKATNYEQALQPLTVVTVTTPLTGTILTGPDGFFAFPVDETAVYWVRVEKDGYTYGQREVEIVRERSTATTAIYLTPIDSNVTYCDDGGCQHTNSDGTMQVMIPPGAILPGEIVTTTATQFTQVEFLPEGTLPPGTWETYAFDVGGDTEAIFQEPVTVTLENSRGFAPGTQIPLGYWNEKTMQWEHEGFAEVDPSGQWVVMQLMHFSPFDPNFPVEAGNVNGNGKDQSSDGGKDCKDNCNCIERCFIDPKSGTLGEDLTLPSITILGEDFSPNLAYNSNKAMPTEVIDIQLSLDSDIGSVAGNYIEFELFIEGIKTDMFTFSATLTTGEVGRYRYLWDGRDSQGNLLPPGVYKYTAKFNVPYTAQYCGTTAFGGDPDCDSFPTGVFVEASEEIEVRDTIELDTQTDTSLGSGWFLDNNQRLYENEAGQILVVDGHDKDEFYFGAKSLLAQNPLPANSPSLTLNLPMLARPQITSNQVSTPVCGELSADTVWTEAQSPYVLNCSVLVPESITLTIEPSVIIQFANVTDSLIVSGTLQSVGTETNPILFQPLTGTTPGSWGQIAFRPNSSGILDYVIVEYGGNTKGSIFIESDDVEILNAVVQYSADTGIAIQGVSTRIAGSQILNNTTTLYGGGIYNNAGSLTLQNSYFENNSANSGGALWDMSLNSVIEENIFRNNIASFYGGAIQHQGINQTSNTIIQNNIFTENHSDWGGGVLWMDLTDVTVRNNTLHNNTVNGQGIILIGTSQNGGIYNNIVVNNSQGIFSSEPINMLHRNHNITLDHNNVWANGINYGWGISPGPNSISNDPLFVDAENGNFHLQFGSLSIDAGDPDNYPELDFDGLPRFVGDAPDIGADEFGNSLYPISLTSTDYSRLVWDWETNTYTRLYLDGTQVHFNEDGTHDFTLEPNGRLTSYTYNPDGTVATMGITAPGESTPDWVWTFHYVNGKLSHIIDPANRLTDVDIDQHNNLRAFTLPDGSSQQFAYDANHLMTQYIDEEGAITSHIFDAYGRIREVIEPPRFVYEPDTGQTSTIQETVSFTPSETAYPLINDSIIGNPDNPAPPVPATQDLIDDINYGRGKESGLTNRWGSWLQKTDGLSRTVVYEYDDNNNQTFTQHEDGDCVEKAFDEVGNVLTKTYVIATQCGLPVALRSPDNTQQWLYTYEPEFNQIKTETDPRGYTTTYIYDYEEEVGNAGNLIRIIYPPVADEFGNIVTPTMAYTYNEWGLIETETDPRGTVTRYVYTQGTPDEASDGGNPLFAPGTTPVPGLLTQRILDDGGFNLTTTYRDFDAAGNAGTIIQPDGRSPQTYTYDSLNRILTMTDAEGRVMMYEYDGRSNRIRQTVDYTPDGVTGRNVVTAYTYDDDDQLLSETTLADGLTVQTQYTYDINRKLAREIDGRGNQTLYRYDEADQLTQIIDPLGYTISRTYTLDGQLATATDADGYTTRYLYDGFDRLITQIVDEGGLNLTTHYTYDNNDNLLTATDAVGTVTCYEYDSHNRRTTQIQDCGGLDLRTEYVYDLNGNVVYETDERGIVTYTAYDALNRPTLIRLDDGGLNLENSLAYDAAGNLASETDERGIVTSYVYDDLNRLTAVCQDANTLNLCTTYEYDRLDNRTAVTDPNGITTRTQFNAFGSPITTIDDEGGIHALTHYTYDNTLNLTAITDNNGNSTRYTFTGRNQLASEQYADGTTIRHSYDGRGHTAVMVNQDGATITHTYDGAGRLQDKTFSTGGTQQFAYDEMSRLTLAEETMHGHTSRLTFAYDPLSSVISTTQQLDGVSWTTGYTYDYSAGQTTLLYPSGAQRVQTLDPLRRLETVQRGDNSTIATYTYADLDSYTTLAYENGTTTRTEYDALRRITQVSSEVGDYRYGYDDASNRTYMQRMHQAGQPADVYQYDGLYQLTQVWYGADATDPANITDYDRLQWYDLDTLGNRLEVNNDGASELYGPNDGTQLTNPMNRYEQVDGVTFAYDLRGNTLTDGRNSYTYDIFNRQTGMNNADHTAEYIYDATGRRIAKVVDGQTTYFIYNNRYQVIEERDGNNSLLARYTYGSGIDEPLTMERDGATTYYHRDGQTSITELTDSNGLLVERYEYDVYGQPTIFDDTNTVLTTSAVQNPYLYTARRYDPESDNFYFRARAYAFITGRFLQMDPLGYVDGMNLYNNYFVINKTDPMGNITCCEDERFLDWRTVSGDKSYYTGEPMHRYENGILSVPDRLKTSNRGRSAWRKIVRWIDVIGWGMSNFGWYSQDVPILRDCVLYEVIDYCLGGTDERIVQRDTIEINRKRQEGFMIFGNDILINSEISPNYAPQYQSCEDLERTNPQR